MSHREDGARWIRRAARSTPAFPVTAGDVETAQLISARTDMDAGSSVEAVPLGFKALNPRRESIVEPIVDAKAASEVPDETTTP